MQQMLKCWIDYAELWKATTQIIISCICAQIKEEIEMVWAEQTMIASGIDCDISHLCSI